MNLTILNREIFFTENEINTLKEFEMYPEMDFINFILFTYGVEEFDTNLSELECHDLVIDAINDYNLANIETLRYLKKEGMI